MKAITIWQPWASLLVMGRKLYETRDWATNYRGPIAIHAAKRPVRKTIDALVADRHGPGWVKIDYLDALFTRPGALDQLPTGAIIGTAILERCNPVTDDFLATLTPQEKALGDFLPGMFAWEFSKMALLDTPVPMSGARGLWNWNGKGV